MFLSVSLLVKCPYSWPTPTLCFPWPILLSFHPSIAPQLRWNGLVFEKNWVGLRGWQCYRPPGPMCVCVYHTRKRWHISGRKREGKQEKERYVTALTHLWPECVCQWERSEPAHAAWATPYPDALAPPRAQEDTESEGLNLEQWRTFTKCITPNVSTTTRT